MNGGDGGTGCRSGRRRSGETVPAWRGSLADGRSLRGCCRRRAVDRGWRAVDPGPVSR
jgi:hypothetical protein